MGKKKTIIIAVVSVVVLLGVIGALTDKDEPETGVNATQSETQATTQEQTAKPIEWKKLLEFSPDGAAGSSGVFKASGNPIRITYTTVSTSTGGNAMIYMLEKGTTVSQDANGNIRVAQADAMAFGTKTSSQTIQKAAGEYFIDVNSSSISSITITVEEQIMD